MKVNILEKKWYLYLTEFFSGMAVMAVELGASRLLAPYFSSSQIVWTIIIGTIMIAMAIGNVMGGKWSDKDPDPAKLFRRILVAAAWIALIPFLGRYVILGIMGIIVVAINHNMLIWAAFAACMIIFVYPLFLLGTVTPSLIRFTMSDVEESGRVAGRLGACNTVGSIIGTFLPTFVTIPAVGTSVTFLIFSGILLVLGALYFVFSGGKKTAVLVCAVLYIFSCIFGWNAKFAFWIDDLTYEGESVYNYLQVSEDDREVILSTNVMIGVQSVYMKNDTLTGMYYDYALGAPVMAGKEDPKVLILGMGTGTFALQCKRYFPDADIEGVEIDEKITALAREYFNLPESIPVTTYDGRAFLNASKDKYDIIMVDAYQDITIPFQMSSVEFFSLVKEHLNEDGIMIVNLNMHGEEGDDDTALYLTDTVASVFPYVCVADVPYTTNREMFAAVDGDPGSKLSKTLKDPMPSDLKRMMDKLSSRLITVSGGDHIWTDDKAPVELIGMKTIDLLIQDEASYYKDLYEKEGIKGLVNDIIG
ncbi:MAG: fused MFS/spermidine synthase [Firmicutes bacterium]|nr:fused MFS/spermidine synthase [Bacillota bacterium]